MGSRAEHLARAEENAKVIELLTASAHAAVARWVVIIHHYAAREWIHAVLDGNHTRPQFQHPDTHPDTKRAWSAAVRQSGLVTDLQVLESLSLDARYLGVRDIGDSWWRASYLSRDDAVAEAAQRLASIRSWCETTIDQTL